MGRPKKQSCMESFAIANGKVGDFFYTEKPDKLMTASAVYYKRKIKTERLIVITTGGKDPIAKYITRVEYYEF
jgi:hypothetical protein